MENHNRPELHTCDLESLRDSSRDSLSEETSLTIASFKATAEEIAQEKREENEKGERRFSSFFDENGKLKTR